MKLFVTSEIVLEFIKENNLISLEENRYNIFSRIDGDRISFKRRMHGCGFGVGVVPEFWFSNFDFGGECFGKINITHGDSASHEMIADPDKIHWRSFVAKKCGEEYIKAYKEYMEENLKNREELLNHDKIDFENEILVLQNF